METYYYLQFPHALSTVHLALFTDVRNARDIKSRLVKASHIQGPAGTEEKEALNFAFINASLICSILHLKTAIYRAILSQVQGSLRTKSVHSEILWFLNPTSNISEAIKRYGISDSTTSILVVKVTSPDIQHLEPMATELVSGTLSPLASLTQVTDWVKIKKYHKLLPNMGLPPGLVRQDVEGIESVVVSVCAMKDMA